MLEIAGELTSRGASVELSSSGEVAALIERRGYKCHRLPLADVRYSETGEFSQRGAPRRRGSWVPGHRTSMRGLK